ncbi:glycoside hydrolase family 76 protein [Pengzhenrongella phosphoraccumulans]|uniref:glycoside hydrolase family 76 protein n=1 Tax=Pengzhenrongella phosphoraccumulans TaxID=3114394 RepID=UPI003890E65D
MPPTAATTWATRADTAQRSLEHFFGASEPQLFNNSYPLEPGDNDTFNYWWLAHIIDVRIDAYQRTGDPRWLEAAALVYRNILERNDGSPFNDYFDDMLWLGLAILRLHDATGDQGYLNDARAIWDHVVEFGWNDQHGQSVAWRKQQLHYKNTPANGPFIILSCRLAAHSTDPRYLSYAQIDYDWLTSTLVRPDDAFVEDGIDREGDGRIDTQWRFTYNQGLYIGASVELARATGNRAYLDQASRTAITAIRELANGGVFTVEGSGGDEGLFKGVYYRYAGLFRGELDTQSEARLEIEDFIRTSTNALWEHAKEADMLLAGNDWSTGPTAKTAYSTLLSAIMALEVRADLERA